MGCFLGCFGGSKDQKRRNKRNKINPREQRHGTQNPVRSAVPVEESILESPLTPPTKLIPEIKDRSEEQLSSSARKRVTFDSNVTTYEHVSAIYESIDPLPGKIELEKEENDDIRSSPLNDDVLSGDSVTSTVGSYPSNYRYQNYRDSEDEAEEYGDSDLDDEDDNEFDEDYHNPSGDSEGKMLDHDVWSESVLAESMNESSSARIGLVKGDKPLIVSGTPLAEPKTTASKGHVRDRSAYVHSVLNPVENLTQWKAVKSKVTETLKQAKDSFAAETQAPLGSFGLEPTFKQSYRNNANTNQFKYQNQEIAVDASLSTWLASPETTPVKKASLNGPEITSAKSMSQGTSSVMKLEDRPILGALTVEELRQFSVSSSPRRSPSRSPDEMPIIGTVGTYWNHAGSVKKSGSPSSFKGIPNTTSKYREDKRVNWHSTPFETRLERALNRGASDP